MKDINLIFYSNNEMKVSFKSLRRLNDIATAAAMHPVVVVRRT